MSEIIAETESQYNERVKREAEKYLNVDTNRTFQKVCPCSKKEKGCFYWNPNGTYKCSKQNCGLPETEGNYHTLNKSLKFAEERKKETKPFDPHIPDYVYKNEAGQILYGIKRYVFEENGKRKKSFNPAILENGKWVIIKSKNPDYERLSQEYKSIRKALYNLDKFNGIKTLWIVEGEKCADLLNKEFQKRNLSSYHLATTNPGGAERWIRDFTLDIIQFDSIEKVIILPDKDKAGFYHARKVYHELEKKALVIPLENLEDGQGIDDWLENSKNKLEDLINHANRYDLTENYGHEFLDLGWEYLDRNIDPEENNDYELNEISIKNRFIDLFGENVMFVEKLNWFYWNGTFWEETDDGQRIRGMVVKTIREYKKDFDRIKDNLDSKELARAEKEYSRFHKEMMSHSKVNSIIKEISYDPRIYKKNNFLNCKDHFLNVMNGVIDLKTGYLMSHKREYYFTKVININYPTIQVGLPVKTDLWNDFIKWAFMDRQDLIEYVQMMVGYSLTGSTQEQNIFFMTGTGANGKSTFINIIQKLLGGYYKKLNSDSLMDKKNRSPINNDIAQLYDARLTISSEIEDGNMWNMSLVKDLSGGEDISARFLKKEFFIFRPKFKIWIYGNYKPYLKGLDEGTKRRFRIIPFDNKISDKERKDDLEQLLKEELPGILLWAVEGAKKYFELKKTIKKIPIPDCVQIANDEYFRENDPLIEFLEDWFDSKQYFEKETIASAYIDKSVLYKEYKAYSEEIGNNRPYARNSFSKKLKDSHGFKDKNVREGSKVIRVYYDLKAIGERFKKERERRGEL